MWYVYPVEYYSAVQNNEIVKFCDKLKFEKKSSCVSYPDAEIEILCCYLSTAVSFKLPICMLQFEQSPNK